MNAFAQMHGGRALVFAAPVVEPHHLFGEIAHGLSLIARFAGQTDVAYSVAQHSVQIAEAIEDETGDVELAALGLLHDAHEASFGDWPRPAKRAVMEEMRRAAVESGASEVQAAALAEHFRRAEKAVAARLARAILAAAGLDPAAAMRRGQAVAVYDERALWTERRDLLAKPERQWPDFGDPEIRALPLRRNGRIKPWPAGKAEAEFVSALIRLCPVAARACGRAIHEGDAL